MKTDQATGLNPQLKKRSDSDTQIGRTEECLGSEENQSQSPKERLKKLRPGAGPEKLALSLFLNRIISKP